MSHTVVCMKWGARYGPDFANRLHSMVRRHLTGPLRFVCFTDDASELDPAIETQPLPPIELPERVRWLGWRKLSLFQHPLADLEGDVLFLDLDVVVTGPLDDFFAYAPGEFCVIRNWTQPRERIGNTSAYRWRAGNHAELYQRLMADPEPILARYRNSQKYVSGEIGRMVFWPAEWCVSFKHGCMPAFPLNFLVPARLPEGARIVAFTGHPDPDEAIAGAYPVKKAWKKLYKHCRPTPWVAEHWR